MKKIMIDMDDVICQGGFLKLVNNFLGTNYKIEEIKSYYIQDIIPEDKKQEWENYYAQENVYQYAKFLPDAYETMEKLSKEYELYIATSYIYHANIPSSSKDLKDKFTWLYKNIPFIKPDNYIFINNKELLNCEIKIDDKIENLEGEAELKLLFSAYHNRKLSKEEIEKKGVIRVEDWKEIENRLLNT